MNDSFLVTTTESGGNDYAVKKTRVSDCIPLFQYTYLYMKYIIRESQINNIIYEYLDVMNSIEIKRGNIIYFLSNEGDEYAKIRFDKDTMWVGISNDICNEITSFFSLNKGDCGKIINEWIKKKFKTNEHIIVQTYLKDEIPIFRVPY